MNDENKKKIPVPCPDGRPGCAVAHYRIVDEGDEKREAMIAAANADIDNHDWFYHPEEFAADFALEQMRPLEKRIAELERRLAVARDLLNDYHTLLAHIRNSPIGRVGDHSIYTTQHNSSRIEKQIAQVANAIRGEAAKPKAEFKISPLCPDGVVYMIDPDQWQAPPLSFLKCKPGPSGEEDGDDG